MKGKTYICIDLKSFFASVECVERGLDPLKTNLVVADPERCNGTICLAITPTLKEHGIRNRCRLFEIPKNIKYIQAPPRMKKYIEYSANVYAVYLKYIAKEDIHVYSIDEAFMDVTNYLSLYNMSAKELSIMIMNDILSTVGITATCGIGTNLYLAKIALDITAKHVPDHIGYLDEESYKKELWSHEPLIDFWRVGRGTEARLKKLGIYNMEQVANAEPKLLYKTFGINAEYLIDHAWGRESCTIEQIKAYKSKAKSLSNNQVLFRDYSYIEAQTIVIEMVELMCQELVEKRIVTNNVSLYIGYSKDIFKATGGSTKMYQTTNSNNLIIPYFLDLYKKSTNRSVPIRRVGISFNNIVDEKYEQYDLFTDIKKTEEDKMVQQTINHIKRKYGKNSMLTASNLLDEATTIERNKMIGGHKSGN